ncbi:MAG TPA: hypothetical protein VH183_04865 [Burkholderiaceae bacterium]|nr:hypothetical protein [Burkholderiaceae bacterium]
MKRMLAMAACCAGFASAAAAADVGVSIQFSQPGVFGRVDIGQFPQPQVIVAQPVVVAPPPIGVPSPEPVYLWVPLEHRKHWDRYCGEYHACGHPVYFVNHVWYRNNVLAHRGEGRHEEERGREHARGWEEREGHRGRDEEEHDRGRGHSEDRGR